MLKNNIAIDLNGYFNSKILINANEIDKSKLLLNNVGTSGELFDSATFPDSNKNLIIHSTLFTLPNKSYNLYDAISCEAQIIRLPISFYSSINILLTGMNGCFHEKLGLNYIDGSQDEVNVDFLHSWHRLSNTSWEYDKYRGLLAFECKELESRDIRRIFYQDIAVPDTKKKLTSIDLPYNPNAYIFSITLKVI